MYHLMTFALGISMNKSGIKDNRGTCKMILELESQSCDSGLFRYDLPISITDSARDRLGPYASFVANRMIQLVSEHYGASADFMQLFRYRGHEVLLLSGGSNLILLPSEC